MDRLCGCVVGHLEVGRKPRCVRLAPQPPFPQANVTGSSLLAIDALQRDSCVTANGGRYTMEFKTKAPLTEWANDQTMAEIAAYYNGLPGVKPVKKFESRDVAVTRIWAALSPDKPKVARKPKAGRMKATSRR